MYSEPSFSEKSPSSGQLEPNVLHLQGCECSYFQPFSKEKIEGDLSRSLIFHTFQVHGARVRSRLSKARKQAEIKARIVQLGA
jgi:hypothetical protein